VLTPIIAAEFKSKPAKTKGSLKTVMSQLQRLRKAAETLLDHETLAKVEEYTASIEEVVITTPSGQKRSRAAGKSAVRRNHPGPHAELAQGDVPVDPH
jgi:hypothetical protein